MITRKETALRNIEKGNPKTHNWSEDLYADEELCIKAVEATSYAICGIPDEFKTEKICLSAVKNGSSLGQVPPEFITNEVVEAALKKFGMNLVHVPSHLINKEYCEMAMDGDPLTFPYVPEEYQTEEMCLKAVKAQGCFLHNVIEENKTREICVAAINEDANAIEYVPKELLTKEMCFAALNADGKLMRYLPEEMLTKELCFAAAKNGCPTRFIPKRFYSNEMFLVMLKANQHADIPYDFLLDAFEKAVGGESRGITPTAEEEEEWETHLRNALSSLSVEVSDLDTLDSLMSKFISWNKEHGGYHYEGEDRFCSWIAQEYDRYKD